MHLDQQLNAPNRGFYVNPVRSSNNTSIALLGISSSNEIIQNSAVTSFDSSSSFLGSSTPLSIKLDGTGEQLKVCGSTNVNKQLMIGFNTTNNYGQIQAIEQGVAFRDLILNLSNSSNVGIGLTGPSFRLHLADNSAAKPTSNTWTISSDARIKENIVDANLDICYDVVKNLRLRRYKWKDEYYPYTIDKNSVGWIAQEVQEVFPKAVNVTERQQFFNKETRDGIRQCRIYVS